MLPFIAREKRTRHALLTDDSQLTGESVSDGHPDKVCDQISDASLDSYLAADPHSPVGLETPCTKDNIVLAGKRTALHAWGPQSPTLASHWRAPPRLLDPLRMLKYRITI
jgi:hypothetical protein